MDYTTLPLSRLSSGLDAVAADAQATFGALDATHPRTIWQRLPPLPSLFGRLPIRSQAPQSTRTFTASPLRSTARAWCWRTIIGTSSRHGA
jgi:hypothetical protein